MRGLALEAGTSAHHACGGDMGLFHGGHLCCGGVFMPPRLWGSELIPCW